MRYQSLFAGHGGRSGRGGDRGEGDEPGDHRNRGQQVGQGRAEGWSPAGGRALSPPVRAEGTGDQVPATDTEGEAGAQTRRRALLSNSKR